MISCKRATELISRSIDEPLSVGESLMLRFHLYICEFCEQFRKQLLIIRAVIKKEQISDSSMLSGPAFPPDAKERILARLKKEKAGSN